jgi:hypothetical protein
MRRAFAVALALSICACRHVGPLADADADAGTDTDTAPLEPGDLLWAASIDRGEVSDLLALADGDLLAVGTNGDGATIHGAASGEVGIGVAGAFVAEYAADGAIVAVDSPILDRGLTSHAALADDGSPLLAGAYFDLATFGPGSPGEQTFVALGNDGYVGRLDGGGGFGWLARIAGAGYESAIDVAALTGGGAAAVGTFGFIAPGEEDPGTATVVDGHGDETPLVSAGGGDAFAARFGPDGELAWIATAGGAGIDLAYAVAVRPDGSIAIAGEYGNNGSLSEGNQCAEPGEPAVFGAGAEAIALAPAGATDGFVASYSADGALQWARSVGGPCMDWIRDVVALDDGSIVATGVIGGPATFGAGEEDETTFDCGGLATCDEMQRIFLAAFAPDGDLEWARASGFCVEENEDARTSFRADELAASADGALALAGGYVGTCTLGFGEAGATELPRASMVSDPFVAALSPVGLPRWAATGAGECLDEARAVTFTADGNVAAGGLYAGDDDPIGTWGWCGGPVAFGAGEPNETELPAPPDVYGPNGFVAVFIGE